MSLTLEGKHRFNRMAAYLRKVTAIESELYGEDREKWLELIKKGGFQSSQQLQFLAMALQYAAREP